MAIWFQIALVLNVVYWAVFFYLLTRRRWNITALAVGIFHLMFAAVVSVAPIRSLLDPDYIGYGLGVIHFEKRAVAFPAALILGWALAAAWIAVGKGRGRWMRLVMVGDLFFALSMGVSILLDDSQNWKFQLGEHFTATGVAGLLILLCFFSLTFRCERNLGSDPHSNGWNCAPARFQHTRGSRRLRERRQEYGRISSL